jgi:hypothetical protein
LIDKSVEGEAEMEAEHGILGLDVEQAKAMIRKRGPATLRESVLEDQTQPTIIQDVSRAKIFFYYKLHFSCTWGCNGQSESTKANTRGASSFCVMLL